MSIRDGSRAVGPVRVAVLMGDRSNPFWTGMLREYESLAPGVGMDIDFFWGEPEKDRQAQLDRLLAILDERYDAVIVNPIGNRNLLPGIVKASSLGVPILDVGAKTDRESVRAVAGTTYHPVRTVDFFTQGRMAGQYICRALSTAAGSRKVAIIEGRPDSAQSIGRAAGASQAFAALPDIRLICRKQADFDRAGARAAAQRVFETDPDVAAFFCANDVMALGVADAVRGLPGAREVVIVGVDLTPESREAIRRGFMTASVAFSPRSVARVVLDAVGRVMAGKEAEKGYTVESTLVDRENVDSYEG